jgi:hypothetical protein
MTLNPRKLAAALSTPRIAEMTVYHGSPHTFENFDASKIGTGEGAQAYGHGIYVAENPVVAGSYKYMDHPALGGDPRDSVTALRQNWQGNDNPRNLNESEVKYLMKDFPDLVPHIDNPNIVKNIAKVVNGQEAGGTASTEAIYAMRALDKQLPPKPVGNLYTVDLPDEKIDKMLDWDNALEDHQISKIMAAVQKNKQLKASDFEDALGLSSAYSGQPESGSSIYRLLSASLGGDAKASEFLTKNGIPGIKYFDAGSRDGGKGTRNFVIFPGEEQNLKILERK